MSLIGKTLLRLKRARSLASYGCLVVGLLISVRSVALDRVLSDNELKRLEFNISQSVDSLASAYFLIQHYSLKKNWEDVVRVAQPRQKQLTPAMAELLVRAYLQLGDGLSAQSVLGQIHGQRSPSGDSKLLETQALIAIAKNEKTDIEKMNRAQQALQTIRDAVDLEPKNKKIYLQWVNLLREFWPSFAQDALNVIKVMEQKTEDYESSLSLKCELYTKASLWDQGLVACQRAIKAKPQEPMSYLYLAEVLGIKVGSEERKKKLLQVGRDHPRHYEVQKTLAEMYYSEQNYVESAAKFKLLVDLQPTDLEAILKLAQSEFKIKEYRSALDTYKKHCKNSRMIASEFKEATKQLRSDKSLHKFYSEAMQSCR